MQHTLRGSRTRPLVTFARTALLEALALASLVSAASAQCLAQELSVAGTSYYGSTVAASEDVLLVTELGPSALGVPTVHVWERTGNIWQSLGALPTPPEANFQWYGSSLAVEGDLALVGNVASSGSGSAFLFERGPSGWELAETLQPPTSNGAFGRSVAIDRGRLFVSGGLTYIFELQGGSWDLTAQLNGPLGASYGTALAVEGNHIVVGGRFEEVDNENLAGTAFVHSQVGGVWSEAFELTPSVIGSAHFYGSSLDVSGDRIAVGTGLIEPRVHIFELQADQTWLETALIQELAQGDVNTYYGFGGSLDLRGERLLVSAFLGAGATADSGVGFLYEEVGGQWLRRGRFFPPNAAGGGPGFGRRVTFLGDGQVLGASTQWNDNQGAAWLFDLSQGELAEACVSTPNSSGQAARIDSLGSTSIAYNDFRLTASGLPVGRFGLFFYGPSETQVPFGNGTLCVTGGFFRLGPPILSNLVGAIERPLDFQSPPASGGPGQIVPGSTWIAQLWFRDPAGGGAGFDMSNALRMSFCP